MPAARKAFGTPPRDCPKCGRNGMVLDTRVYADYIRRRHSCAKRHRWTSVQIHVDGYKHCNGGTIKQATANFRIEAINSLIAELKAMR